MTNKVVVDLVRNLAAQGLSQAKIAGEIGCSQMTVSYLCKKEGIVTDGQCYADTTARNQEILTLFNEQKTLEEIGIRYGISRERVRQIVGRFGVKTKREQSRERDAKIVSFAKTAKSQEEVFAIFPEFTKASLTKIILKHGIRGLASEKTMAKQAALQARVDGVIALWRDGGKSVQRLCGGDRYLEVCVNKELQRLGLREKRKRASDVALQQRIDIAQSVLAEGGDFNAYYAAIREAEDGKPRKESIRFFLYNNHKEILYALNGNREAKRRGLTIVTRVIAPRPQKAPDAEVIIKATIKETAIANRGRVSASRIGAAVGVSRNSIIGHWNRSKAREQVQA